VPPRAGAARRGRLVFALDATASRKPTWDRACHIQAEMFHETAALGGLDVQLVFYRGFRECKASKWHSDPAALGRVEAWWRAVGARVCTMPAEEHDRVLALTSHLPHLLVFAYLQLVDDEHLEHTAGGFRDFTRIGAADARMWGSILRLNREAVLAALERLEGELQRARSLIEADDDAGLLAFLAEAARRRGSPVGANSRSRSGDRSYAESRSGDRSYGESGESGESRSGGRSYRGGGEGEGR